MSWHKILDNLMLVGTVLRQFANDFQTQSLFCQVYIKHILYKKVFHYYMTNFEQV